MESHGSKPTYPNQIVILMSFLSNVYNSKNSVDDSLYPTLTVAETILKSGIHDNSLMTEIIETVLEEDDHEHRKRFYKGILNTIFKEITLHFVKGKEPSIEFDAFKESILTITEMLRAV